MMKWYLIRAIYHVITNKRVNGIERIDPSMDFSTFDMDQLGKIRRSH